MIQWRCSYLNNQWFVRSMKCQEIINKKGLTAFPKAQADNIFTLLSNNHSMNHSAPWNTPIQHGIWNHLNYFSYHFEIFLAPALFVSNFGTGIQSNTISFLYMYLFIYWWNDNKYNMKLNSWLDEVNQKTLIEFIHYLSFITQ